MNKLTKNILIGVAAGLAASWIKSKAEPQLQEIGEKIFPPRADQLSLEGADIKRQPENMPSAVLANSVYEEVTGKPLSRKAKIKAMKCMYYTAGAGIGVMYVSAANPIKILRKDNGAAAGAFIWGLTQGVILPNSSWQNKVRKMPKSWWVWQLGSHLVYGVALEQSRKILSGIFNINKKKKKNQ